MSDLTPELQQERINRRMRHKPYRFIWFAKASWSYLQGDRWQYFNRFWPSWRRFNSLVVHDLKCTGCCECD